MNAQEKLEKREKELNRELKAVRLRKKEQELKGRAARLLDQAKKLGAAAADLESEGKEAPTTTRSYSKKTPSSEKT